jgi:hypothetical protein
MHLVVATTVGLVVLTATGGMSAQMPGMPVPGGCDTPVKERTSEVGCYLLATEALGTLPQGPVFWHLYSYATRSAAEAVRGPRGTLVESFGKIWLYTIAEQGWRPAGGERVAVIGPFTTAISKPYTARYMESALTPGDAVKDTSAFRTRGYVRGVRRAVCGDPGSRDRHARGRRRDTAGGVANASDRRWHGDAPRSRACAPRQLAILDNDGSRVAAEGSLSEMSQKAES